MKKSIYRKFILFLIVTFLTPILKADYHDYDHVPDPFSKYKWFESALDELHDINISGKFPEKFDVSYDGEQKCTATLTDNKINTYIVRYHCASKSGSVYFSIIDYTESPYYQYQGKKELDNTSVTVFDDGVANYRTYLFENQEQKLVYTSGGGDKCGLNWNLFINKTPPPESLRKEIMSALKGTPNPKLYSNYFYWVEDINQYANQLGEKGASCKAKQVVRNLSSYEAFLRVKSFDF